MKHYPRNTKEWRNQNLFGYEPSVEKKAFLAKWSPEMAHLVGMVIDLPYERKHRRKETYKDVNKPKPRVKRKGKNKGASNE